MLPQPIGITEKVSRRWTPSKVRVSIKYIPVGSEEVSRPEAALQLAAHTFTKELSSQ
jgi:hypothetical protein